MGKNKSELIKKSNILLGIREEIKDERRSIQGLDHESVITHKKLKFKSNSFALGRTAFRGMSNYYKKKFDPILKEWEMFYQRESMDSIVSRFISIEFNYDQDVLHNSDFIDCMTTILHSQNYRKEDDYIVRRDFKKIRSLLYCYSSNAKKAFIKDKYYAIIYSNFYIKDSQQLLESKSKGKYQEFRYELGTEMEDIHRLSLKTISETI